MKLKVSSLSKLALLVVLMGSARGHAEVTVWNAFNDFYVNVPATGGAGDFQQADWINLAGQIPYATGLVTPNAWGYAGGNFNGVGAPANVGTYISGGNLYRLTSGGFYAGPGASYLLGGQDFWIGYNDNYALSGLPSGQTQIGKYTKEWFANTPNYAGNFDGVNDKYLWLQGTGLSPTTDGLGAILTWTAPTTGKYQVNGSYVNGDYGFRTNFAIVDSLNNVFVTDSLSRASSEYAFSFEQNYAAGDVIQFQVGTPASAQGSPLGLAVNITIPEPSSGALFTAGLGALGLFRRRR